MTDKLEQLSLAARRGALSPADEQELEQLLRAEPEERLWHEAGLRFDAEEEAENDAEAVERLRQRLALRAPIAARRRRVPTVVLLAAAALLLASAAAAFVAAQRYRARESSVAPPAPAPVQSLKPPTPRSEPVEVTKPLPDTPSAPSAPPSEPQLSAAELFSAAGQARRQGQTTRALGLLQTLRARYPGSAEALASDITLGMLRLQSGAPALALGEFERYLQHAPSGARTADALWGKAQALSALGRSAEARSTLQSLLSRYPSSPYTSAAQAKLRSLSP